MEVIRSKPEFLMRDIMDGDSRREIKISEHGFVALVDVMPRFVPGDRTADYAVIQAARVSVGQGLKTEAEDRNLIRYMMSGGYECKCPHCYHPSMEVLTTGGWKRWDQCDYEETFLVPDPVTRSLVPEVCKVDVFSFNGDMCNYNNSRMSYSVTPNHRMWFKAKYHNRFDIVRAGRINGWGHFDPLAGYRMVSENVQPSAFGQLIGFILGDGSWKGGAVNFHLKKDRKKQYLRQCLSRLGVSASESQSSTYEDAIYFWLGAPTVRELRITDYIEMGSRAADKRLLQMPARPEDIAGVFDGLCNSDGHVNHSRNNRIEFSSTSVCLIRNFELLSAMMGYDAHRRFEARGVHQITATPSGRTTLEARKEYFSTEHYRGPVYCTKTGTGLLMVRGGSDKFAFVCGNSSPFEMVKFKFHHVLPIFVARQLVRHRMVNLNEYSARYSVVKDRFYIPAASELRGQGGTNKQVSEGAVEDVTAQTFLDRLELACKTGYSDYQEALNGGVGRELARMILPLNTFTEWYWCVDMHNLFHFLNLRMDSHAQKEIRDYANAMWELIQPIVPVSCEAFRDYKLESVTLSRLEVEAMKSGESIQSDNKREQQAWEAKKLKLGLKHYPA